MPAAAMGLREVAVGLLDIGESGNGETTPPAVLPHWRSNSPIGSAISARAKPNSRQIHRFRAANGGNKLLVTINGEGRLGDSTSRPHILVYGDSFISAIFTPINQTLAWQLEQKLNGTLTPAL